MSRCQLGGGVVDSAHAAVDASATPPGVIAEKATFWLDAADRSTLGVDANGDVTNWVSKAGDRRVATYSGDKPTLDEDSWGAPVLDFGAIGSRKDMLYTRFTNIRTVFQVIRLQKSPSAFFLGDASVGNVKGEYNFCRDTRASAYFDSLYQNVVAGVWNGFDKVANFKTTVPSETALQVVCVTTSKDAKSNSLSLDRDYTVDSGNRNGGRQLAEVIFFSEVLNDADRVAVSTYLMKKWACATATRVTGADYAKTEAGTTYTAGMELWGKFTLAAGSLVVAEASAQPVTCASLELAGGTLAYAPFGEGTPTIAATGAATVTGPVTVSLPATLAEGTYDIVTAGSFTVADGGSVALAAEAVTGADGASRTLVTTATGLRLTVGERALPKGYAALDWIASTGTQWIDSETKVFDGTTIDMHFSDVCYVINTAFFGQEDFKGWRTLLSQQNPNKLYFHAYGTIIGDIKADADYRVTILGGGLARVSVDSRPYAEYNTSRWSVGADKKLGIFALNTGDRKSTFRLHRFRLAHRARLVRDFVPCRDPQGKAGLWDFVEGKFFSNQGTGRFYGSDEKGMLLILF